MAMAAVRGRAAVRAEIGMRKLTAIAGRGGGGARLLPSSQPALQPALQPAFHSRAAALATQAAAGTPTVRRRLLALRRVTRRDGTVSSSPFRPVTVAAVALTVAGAAGLAASTLDGAPSLPSVRSCRWVPGRSHIPLRSATPPPCS